MKRVLFTIIFSLAVASIGCTRDDIPDPGVKQPAGNEYPLENDQYIKPGVLQVKLTPQAQARFNPENAGSGLSTGVASIDQLIRELNVTKIVRVFPHGGKHENAMRKSGLHLWYNVYFDTEQQMATTRAFSGFSDLRELDVVEPVLRIKRIDGEVTPLTDVQVNQMIAASRADMASNGAATNDPMLHFQWHYHNEGTLNRSKPGADINLYEAWKIETGKPQVIVAIIDGGIAIDHPDLRPNLWVNEAEMNGAEGEDDDDNGYVDDVHGFNFVTMNGEITPHSHGTHVAGTVAAVNNNGIGVAGVAGGNGDPNSGVRLMSCQIFHVDQQTNVESVVADENRCLTFIYAANNGAVIAQNSWEYSIHITEIPQLDKDAIDYFIENAGKDGDGNQIGPLDGGIVIFATGNSNRNQLVLPSSYEKVFSVSSFEADYRKASYSNYGPWVHVAAPGGGGEYADGSMIFSTYPMGLYGFMSGTSMACPHVSGIAALVVSKYGVNDDGTINHGFTNQMLWDRLYAGTNRTIDWFNPEFYPMGVGYINAHKALVDVGQIPPDRVSDISAEGTFEKVILNWRVTEDSDALDRKTDSYQIVVSEENLYGLDFSQLPSGLTPVTVSTSGTNVGQMLSHEFTTLEMGKTYYISIAGVDLDGNISPSTTVKGEMLPNRGPVAENLPGAVSLRKTQSKSYTVPVYDPEGYSWTHTFTPGSAAATATRNADVITLTINGSLAIPGSYSAVLTLTDEQGVQTVVTIPYSISAYTPQLIKDFDPVLFQGPGHQLQFALDDYFYEQDGDAVTYSVESSNASVATATIGTGNILTVASTGLGTVTIKITATDADGSTDASFTVVSRNAGQSVDLYPVPVKKDGILNIRMGEDVNGAVDVALYSMSGARVFNQQIRLSDGLAQTVDISSLVTGNYRVVVKYKNEEITRNITKL